MARARMAVLLTTSTVQAFGGALPPTMPPADFCAAVRSPYGNLSLVAETQCRPPEVRSTAFTARPPDLPPRPLMTVDFAISCSLVRPGRPRYPVLVHRAAVLLHASFRPRLTATPLRFANPSPSSDWIEDSHLQAVDHARHTTRRAARGQPFHCRTTVRHQRVTKRVTRRRPRGKRGSRPLPATAAIDNETLDHLLSAVDDATQFTGSRWNCKALRSQITHRTCGISPACVCAGLYGHGLRPH